MEFSNLWLFLVAVIVLLVTPGPGVLYIISRSLDQGRSAGLVSVLGFAAAGVIHVLAAAVGISALLMTSSIAFNIVKYLGAAYLVYLGCRKLFFSNDTATSNIPSEELKLTTVFYQSVLVEVLNPKTALFFLAFFPQFISTTAGSMPLQFLVLGSIFIVIALVSDGMYALLASSFRNLIIGSTLKTTKIQNWLTGGIYIAMGVVAAFANPSHK